MYPLLVTPYICLWTPLLAESYLINDIVFDDVNCWRSKVYHIDIFAHHLIKETKRGAGNAYDLWEVARRAGNAYDL